MPSFAHKAGGKNRLREIRLRRRMTQTQLGLAAGMTQQQVGKLERGERALKAHIMKRLAKALDCRPEDLLEGSERWVPLAGKVDTGGRLVFFTNGEPVFVDCPRGLDAGRAQALSVDSEALLPVFERGDLIFYERPKTSGKSQTGWPPLEPIVPEALIGRRCVVELASARPGGGETLIGRVLRDAEPGLYTLILPNGAVRQQTHLAWAARAVALPDELVERAPRDAA